MGLACDKGQTGTSQGPKSKGVLTCVFLPAPSTLWGSPHQSKATKPEEYGSAMLLGAPLKPHALFLVPPHISLILCTPSLRLGHHMSGRDGPDLVILLVAANLLIT